MTDEMSASIRRETDYFAKVPFWVQDHPDTDAYSITTYAALYRFADWNPNEDDTHHGAFPSLSTIASRAGCSVSSVRRAISTLERIGALEVEHRDGRSSMYSVRTSNPALTERALTDVGTQSPQDAPPRSHRTPTENPSPRTPNQEIGQTPSDIPAVPLSIVTNDTDWLWEAIVDVHGQPASRSERGKFNKAAKMLRECDPPVTGEEYPMLAQAYVSRYEGGQPSVMTIATRVGEMRHYLQRGPIQAPDRKQIAQKARRQQILREMGEA